jgi:hypothetical protein
MWERLGFKENPYDTKPLNVSKGDVDLLMGRENEQIDFLTAIETSKQGVFVLSGVPGVGKTSFFNIQQYLLESEEALFGPKILSARNLCPIQAGDEPIHILKRCIQFYCKNIESYCLIRKQDVPKQTKEVLNWIYQNKPATFSFGLNVMGNGGSFGREVHLPKLNETTFETLVELLTILSKEVVDNLGTQSSFIVLDNVENWHLEDLNDCLTAFRDTLFMIPNIWWILIGQSGLPSLIQSTNPKVFQRLTSNIELLPITVNNLIKAVDFRVSRFHIGKKGTSPITEDIYLKLFKSSNGEIRFVFKYCHDICVNLVQNVRKELVVEKKGITPENFENLMGTFLVKKQIDDSFSNNSLKTIITREFEGLYLSQKEKQVLKKIGNLSKVKPNDFSNFKNIGIKTMQEFTKNYLSKLNDQYLLFRRQKGKVITYELRGISVFALEFGLLD